MNRVVREDLSEKVTFEKRGKKSGRELYMYLREEQCGQRQLQSKGPAVPGY